MTTSKQQVIELVKSVDSLLIYTNAGEGIINGWDECIEFANHLNDFSFYGEVDDVPAELSESPYYEPEWSAFMFNCLGEDTNTTDGYIYVNIGY